MYDRQDDYDLDEDNEEYLEEDRDAEEQDESDEGETRGRDDASARQVFFPPWFYARNFTSYTVPVSCVK